MPVAQRAQVPQVIGAGDADAALALHRLQQHGDDVVTLFRQLAHGGDIVIRHAQKPGSRGSKPCLAGLPVADRVASVRP